MIISELQYNLIAMCNVSVIFVIFKKKKFKKKNVSMKHQAHLLILIDLLRYVLASLAT